ncbi:MAG: 50S ribosome-binding GTPase [Planctomycetes bacterium]|nr:50S ribosome-binding GTPase [Planctomycetota bacterium]
MQMSSDAGLFAGECAEALSRATTWRTAEILNEQACGLLRTALDALCQEVLAGAIPSALSHVEELLTWAEFGRHLSQPWTVVLTGRPNVGKSSLINALLGYERAIVFDQPGTTRDVVTAETALEGWPVLLADTAGLRDTTEELEAAGIALARERLKVANARLVLVDISQPATSEDRELLADWPDAIVIGHKCDLGDHWNDELPAGAIRASCLTGEGLDQIRRSLVNTLVPRVPPPGTAIPITQRQVQLLRLVHSGLLAGDVAATRQAIEQILDFRP